MANQALVDSIKQIMVLAKSGDATAAHAAWSELFASADFASYRPEDQRQALKLLIMAKRTGGTPPSLLDAFRAAIPPLQELVTAHEEPSDHEMLGTCQLLTGDEAGAATTLRAGLDRERARSAESDLCGRLMKLLAAT